jgi:formate/nitrite transporter FocA (FNT family)
MRAVQVQHEYKKINPWTNLESWIRVFVGNLIGTLIGYLIGGVEEK